MSKIKFRKYSQVINTLPLIDGVVPSVGELAKVIRFDVVAPGGHILSEKEWMDVVGDNILYFNKKPKQKSPYKIEELKFVEVKQ